MLETLIQLVFKIIEKQFNHNLKLICIKKNMLFIITNLCSEVSSV